MYITRLTIDNCLRIKTLRISPDKNVVKLVGANGAGKTSVLNSIKFALMGKKDLPSKPVHDGEKKGHVEIELSGGISVDWTVNTDRDVKLVVKKDGIPMKSPTTMLEALVGKIAFDPLAFVRMEPKKQIETLKQVANLDFSDLEAKYSKLYSDRTAVNVNIKRIDGALAKLPTWHKDAPEKPTPPGELDRNYQAALNLTRDRQSVAEMIGDLDQAIATLEDKLKIAKVDRETLQRKLAGMAKAPDPKAVEALKAQLENMAETNRKAGENARRREMEAELKAARADEEDLSEQLDHVAATKKKRLADAKLPIKGLEFDDNEVVYDGLPISQLSTSGQIRVSLAMAIAMNPELRVCFVRDASLLDKESQKIVAEMAEKHDFQIWEEFVDTTTADSSAIVLEDGEQK